MVGNAPTLRSSKPQRLLLSYTQKLVEGIPRSYWQLPTKLSHPGDLVEEDVQHVKANRPFRHRLLSRKLWSEYKDSNLGPLAPKASALPDCATLGLHHGGQGRIRTYRIPKNKGYVLTARRPGHVGCAGWIRTTDLEGYEPCGDGFSPTAPYSYH